MSEITLNPKYKDLFKDYKNIRIILLAGGRGSGKSFASSLWLTNKFYNSKKNALYLRKFATNIESSVIPQFLQQVSCLNLPFTIKKNSIENRYGKKLYFMGIESSQSSADSKLKSIPELENVLIEEASEITEDEFDKLNLSVRDIDSEPKIVLCFNPSHQSHWIYQKFYKKRDIDYDFNGIKDEVLYIHTTYLDNIDNLDKSFLQEAESTKKYDPIKFQRDFMGKWLNEVDNPLLSKQLLDLAINKIEIPNSFDKIVVSIDPAISVNKNSDATGLSVCGKKDKDYYILECFEEKLSPLEWATKAKQLYQKYNADNIVVEVNQGGDMCEQTLRQVCGTFIKIDKVRATKGKVLRFEPVHALYQQQLIHHCGRFIDLETQLLTFSGNEKDKSPNSVDAMVWAITYLAQHGKNSVGFV